MSLTSSAVERAVTQLPLALLGGEVFSMPVTQKKPRERKAKPKFDHLDLTLPLFTLTGEVAILFDHEEEDTETDIQAVALSYSDDLNALSGAELTPWTDDGIAKLHSVLLEESIKALAARGNAKQKGEILDWLFAPDIVGIDESNRCVYADNVPWTYQFCCRLEGMNPDTIRDFVSRRIVSA